MDRAPENVDSILFLKDIFMSLPAMKDLVEAGVTFRASDKKMGPKNEAFYISREKRYLYYRPYENS